MVLISLELQAMSVCRARTRESTSRAPLATKAPKKLPLMTQALNQPGAAGNAAAKSAGKDPGVNQPGAAGNVGTPAGDPGVNQPGAAGNKRGARR